MAYTDINSEDRLVQAAFAEHLENQLGWESVYAWNRETVGPDGTLGRTDTREVVLVRDLRSRHQPCERAGSGVLQQKVGGLELTNGEA